MKRNTNERHAYILQYIQDNEFADVVFLSQTLGVSEMTIRRDFDKLEEEKKLIRVHGGAVGVPNGTFELSLRSRLSLHREEKEDIGRFAAGLVRKGDVVALDASTTSLRVAEHLAVACTVVTNNLEIALYLLKVPDIETVLLGGCVRKSSASVVGVELTRMMENYRVDKLFFSAKAAAIPQGLFDATVQESEAKKAMIASAEKRYLMLDHSKLNTAAFYKVCDLDSRFEVITNQIEDYSEAQRDFLAGCEERGMVIHYA